MTNQFEAKLARNLMLEALDLRILEIDHLTGFQIDQMIVSFTRDALVAQSGTPERMTFNDPLAREQLQRPVDGRTGYATVPFRDAPMQLRSIRMIFGFGYDLVKPLARHCISMRVRTVEGSYTRGDHAAET